MRPAFSFHQHARAVWSRQRLCHDVRWHVAQVEGWRCAIKIVGKARRGAEGGGYRAIAFVYGEVVTITPRLWPAYFRDPTWNKTTNKSVDAKEGHQVVMRKRGYVQS
jgi:hypothetical protein